jgi:hypothetical protein
MSWTDDGTPRCDSCLAVDPPRLEAPWHTEADARLAAETGCPRPDEFLICGKCIRALVIAAATHTEPPRPYRLATGPALRASVPLWEEENEPECDLDALMDALGRNPKLSGWDEG